MDFTWGTTVNCQECGNQKETTEDQLHFCKQTPKKRKVAVSQFFDLIAAMDSRRTSVYDIVLSDIKWYAEEDLLD